MEGDDSGGCFPLEEDDAFSVAGWVDALAALLEEHRIAEADQWS